MMQNQVTNAPALDFGAGLPPQARPGDLSDAGNAQLFFETFAGQLMYTDALGWLYWTGRRWKPDGHRPLALAMALSEEMLTTAGGDEPLLRHARSSRSAAKIRSMVELSKPAFLHPAQDLDPDPYALNTPQGIVDLRTGEMHRHDPSKRCTKLTADAPGDRGYWLWAGFLDDITRADEDMKGFLQQVMGMALFGKVFHEGIILAYGPGRNGKSTFVNAVAAALGDYAGSVDVRLLTTDRSLNRGAALATLRGKRLALAGELEEGQRLSVSTLKQLASTDMLVIEEKYRAPETVEPTHSLVLFSNFLPRVGSTDDGTWRRILVCPFTASIPADSGVANYAAFLAQEAGPSILSWAIAGAVRFAKNGYKLDIPPAVQEATARYRRQEDWLTAFLGECCVLEENARTPAGELYALYRCWSQRNGEYARRTNDFAAAMTAKGFEKLTPGGRKYWRGLRIDTSVPPFPD